MKQQNLPMLIPVTNPISKKEKLELLRQRYNEIIFQQNEDYFYTQLEELRRLLSS